MRANPKISVGEENERSKVKIAFAINRETISIPMEPNTSSIYSLLLSSKILSPPVMKK